MNWRARYNQIGGIVQAALFVETTDSEGRDDWRELGVLVMDEHQWSAFTDEAPFIELEKARYDDKPVTHGPDQTPRDRTAETYDDLEKRKDLF